MGCAARREPSHQAASAHGDRPPGTVRRSATSTPKPCAGSIRGSGTQRRWRRTCGRRCTARWWRAGEWRDTRRCLRVYREAELHEEKNRCLRALGCSGDPDVLRRTLEFALSEEVRGQDTPLAVAGVAMNPRWDGIWPGISCRRKMGGVRSPVRAGRIHHRAHRVHHHRGLHHPWRRLLEVEAFFESHPAPAATRTVRQSSGADSIQRAVARARRRGHREVARSVLPAVLGYGTPINRGTVPGSAEET